MGTVKRDELVRVLVAHLGTVVVVNVVGLVVGFLVDRVTEPKRRAKRAAELRQARRYRPRGRKGWPIVGQGHRRW